MSVNIYEDMGLGGSGRKVPAVEGVSVPWEEGKGFGVGHMNLMAVAAGTGDRQHPAAELLFVQTHAPVLWRSPEATRYKQVSWAGNGKRAKEPGWAPGRDLGCAGAWQWVGDLTSLSTAPAPFKGTPGTGAGN